MQKESELAYDENTAALLIENEQLKAALETERMRLAACGVVAMADTPDSAEYARNMHPDYRSASCDDVARRVDECMALRKDAERYRWLREQDWNTGLLAVVSEPKSAIKLGYDAPSRQRLDEAIDAAVAAAKALARAA